MTSNIRNLRTNNPKLFGPSVSRASTGDVSEVTVFERSDGTITNNTSLGLSSSYKYNPRGFGLISTQQLNIDWSAFENHTFFNSAQVKTNVAFQKILTEYPFDGSKKDVEEFLDKLTGFEKYVYDSFPKNKGYLFFSGSAISEANGGTYVSVKDLAGATFPNASIKTTAETVINPGLNPMTVEMQLYIPEISSSNQTIVDKHLEDSGNLHGFYISLDSTGSLASGSVTFHMLSGSVNESVTAVMDKGTWNHLAFVWNRTPGHENMSAYVNQQLYASSSQTVEFGSILADTADMTIGSGSAVTDIFTPQTTFSGAIDEFRIWHSVRSKSQRAEFEKKVVFADDDLKLYYRFDEPLYVSSSIVVDYSANSLHGLLEDGSLGVRTIATASVAGESPMTHQKLEFSPILFPDNADVETLRQSFLSDASNFDDQNPNLITRLIPEHYILEGQAFEGLDTEQGLIVSALQSGTDPRDVDLGATQTILLFLYVWAKFFDEIKLHTQALSTLSFVDYDNDDTVPSEFLQELARKEGIELPPLFVGTSIEQYIEAENIQDSISTNDLSLRFIQNQIWRRILINLKDILKSKGTIHSIKSFIRTLGIDPDNNFRIREYGGPTKRSLTYVRDTRSDITTLADFVSGGLIQSTGLTASRDEPGFPEESGTANNNLLLTSGSFTYEGLYRFIPKFATNQSQSLVRMHASGNQDIVWANLVHVSGGNTNLFVRPGDADALVLTVTGADLFDSDPWYVSFGRRRNDDGLDSVLSSSWFLRVAKQLNGEIFEQHVTSSFFHPFASASFTDNILQEYSTSLNPSGSRIVIGSGSISSITASAYLNDQNISNYNLYNYSIMEGRVGQIRYWSKYLTDKEWKEHVRNYQSVGVQEPKTNFNFVSTNTGSWQKLRIDASADQPITESNAAGDISLINFAQNSIEVSGTAFPATSSVLVPERIHFSYISPKYDESATVEKVRVRGFSDFSNVQDVEWASASPVYEIEPSEQPIDNPRFTIDFSIVDALNQDIITMFSTLEELDNALGNPELLFTQDYPCLEDLREVYFNKLTDKVNLKGFFEFFKWFDKNIGVFIEQLVPRKAKYLGTNFVVESHMLERSKLEYHSEDIYLGENNRSGLRDTILLQLITGEFNRY